MATKKTAVERLAERYYPALWSMDALKKLVSEGKLSKAAYKRVTGEEYTEAAE